MTIKVVREWLIAHCKNEDSCYSPEVTEKKQLLCLITSKMGDVLIELLDMARSALEEWHKCLSVVLFACTNGEANESIV